MNTDPVAFRSALPFPHLVVSDACPVEILERAMPAFEEAEWQVFDGEHETKAQAPPPICALPLFRWMRTLGPSLEAMTGIDGLELDLYGGGLHQTTRGGYLGMHVDFNRHPDGRYRRLNMLLFANKGYQAGDGGMLDLGKPDVSRGQPTPNEPIEPLWNRLVVFQTGEDTWHGHPDPWQSDTPRRSFAGYWYTREKPETVTQEHSTVWADA